MKFRAVTTDPLGIKELIGIISTLKNITKGCTINIQPNKLCFIVHEESACLTPVLWAEINPSTFFSEYIMKGLDENKHNEIFLVFKPSNFHHALSSIGSLVQHIKLKLTDKQFPCLTLDIESPTFEMGNNRTISHDIAVEIIPKEDWCEYQVPKLPKFQIVARSINFSSIRNLIEKIKNISPSITVSSNSVGDVSFVIETDVATISSYYKNLPITLAKNVSRDGYQASCKIDAKRLFMFLSSNEVTDGQITCKICDETLVQMIIEIREDLSLNCILPALCFD